MLDRFYVIICINAMQCNYKCNSLFTSFPSHQVSIFRHMHSIHYSAFSLHNPSCMMSHQHAPHHRYNAVVGYQMICGSRAVWRRQPSTAHESAPAPDKIDQKGGKGEILWAHTCPMVSSGPRGRCMQSLVPIGSEMWICIRYKITTIHTSLYIRYLKAHGGTKVGQVRHYLYNCNFLVTSFPSEEVPNFRHMDPVHVPAYRTHYRQCNTLEWERATVVCKDVISCRSQKQELE